MEVPLQVISPTAQQIYTLLDCIRDDAETLLTSAGITTAEQNLYEMVLQSLMTTFKFAVMSYPNRLASTDTANKEKM